MIQTISQIRGNRLNGRFIKQLLAITITMGLVFAACSSSPPKAQVQNNAGNSASVQFKAGDGSTTSFNDIAPGTTSATSEKRNIKNRYLTEKPGMKFAIVRWRKHRPKGNHLNI